MVDSSLSLKKILVPTDGLAHSVKACQYAVGLAKLTGAEIIGGHVLPNQISRIFEERRHLGEVSHDFAGQYRKEGEEYLRQIERLCSREKVRSRTFLVEGYPPEEILKVAQKENVDLIVLGIRRRSSFERHFGIRTSDKIILNSDCPVTIINTPW
ncbi:MAG: universal stress protein [Candidatus Bathyarchaeia archaeon]